MHVRLVCANKYFLLTYLLTYLLALERRHRGSGVPSFNSQLIPQCFYTVSCMTRGYLARENLLSLS